MTPPLPSAKVLRSATLLIAVLAVGTLLPAGLARAEGGWNAESVAQSDKTVVLETGELRTIWFEYRNRDANGRAWERHEDPVADVRIGTSNPRDRGSQFLHSSWIQSTRAGRLDQASVPLNEVGRFTFVVQAPPVFAPIDFTEHFAPLSETLAWMDDAPYTPTSIVFTVRPRRSDAE